MSLFFVLTVSRTSVLISYKETSFKRDYLIEIRSLLITKGLGLVPQNVTQFVLYVYLAEIYLNY